MINSLDLFSFTSLTDVEKTKINTETVLEPQSRSSSSEPVDDGSLTGGTEVPADLEQLGEVIRQLLNEKNLEVSKVRPFFWSLVETYIDRFQLYPFDVIKVLFNYLELNGCPEDELHALIAQLDTLYEKNYGHQKMSVSSTQATPLVTVSSENDSAEFGPCIQIAAQVAEND